MDDDAGLAASMSSLPRSKGHRAVIRGAELGCEGSGRPIVDGGRVATSDRGRSARREQRVLKPARGGGWGHSYCIVKIICRNYTDIP